MFLPNLSKQSLFPLAALVVATAVDAVPNMLFTAVLTEVRDAGFLPF